MRWSLIYPLSLLVACSSTTHPDSASVRVLGTIAGYNSDDPRIEIQPIEHGARVTITTYGGGCHSAGETEVDVHGMEAVITPYDHTAPPGTPCTRQLVELKHEATVSFGRSGTAHVIVRGIDHRHLSAANMVGDTLIVRQTLEIP